MTEGISFLFGGLIVLMIISSSMNKINEKAIMDYKECISAGATEEFCYAI